MYIKLNYKLPEFPAIQISHQDVAKMGHKACLINLTVSQQLICSPYFERPQKVASKINGLSKPYLVGN